MLSDNDNSSDDGSNFNTPDQGEAIEGEEVTHPARVLLELQGRRTAGTAATRTTRSRTATATSTAATWKLCQQSL